MNKRQKEVLQHELDAEKEVLEKLTQQYQRALNDIDRKLRILESDELTQSRIYRIEHQKALKKQVEAVLEKLHADEYTTIQQFLSDSYTDAFIGTVYDMFGQGVPLILPVDKNTAVKAIVTDSKISEGLYEHLGVDTNTLKKSISSEITRGIASGMAHSEIARNIANTAKAPLGRAKTIVRTESHRIQQASKHDAQKAAVSKGANVVKQWNSTMDGDTRPTHRQLDGQIREVDEPFEMGGMKAMYPGAFGDPAEDCNCRCQLLQRARIALDEDELKTLQERAEFFGLDKSDDLADFKKKYMKAAEQVQKDQTEQVQPQRITRRRDPSKYRTARSTPDFDSMDRKQLVSWASDNLKTKLEDTTIANTDYIRETIKVLNKFEEKLGGKTLNGISVKFGGVSRSAYAQYDNRNKLLSLKKSGSLKAFVESRQKDNERSLRKLHQRYHATETFSGTVWHELGHAVDFDSGQALSRALSASESMRLKSVKISAYAGASGGIGATRRSEAWAENFAAYMDGGESAKDVPAEIVKMIEDYFEKKRSR